MANESRERILDVAATLFAEHGYHGVSAREIAAAAGLNVATVHYHTGGKHELYAEVMRRLYRDERALVSGALDTLTPADVRDPHRLRATLDRLVDALVAYLHEHPERCRLYVQSWLEGDDADVRAVETELSLSLHGALRAVLAQAREAGSIRAEVDISLFLRSFSWMLFGYFVTGPIDWATWRGDPHSAVSLAEFTAYLHDYVARMLGLAS